MNSPKRTAKYVAAITKASQIGMKNASRLSGQALYDTLEGAGWFWDSDTKLWSEQKKSTTMFADDTGDPSGMVRVRVMAHPNEADQVVSKMVKELTSFKLAERSEQYPNRRGVGVRVYLTFIAK